MGKKILIIIPIVAIAAIVAVVAGGVGSDPVAELKAIVEDPNSDCADFNEWYKKYGNADLNLAPNEELGMEMMAAGCALGLGP